MPAKKHTSEGGTGVTRRPFFTRGFRDFFILSILLVIGSFVYSIYWFLTATPTMGVIDEHAHSTFMRRDGTERTVSETVIGFHDEKGKYHTFTTSLDIPFPKGTEVEVLYTSSGDRYNAWFKLSAQIRIAATLCIGLIPMLLFFLYYNAYRRENFPKTKDITRAGLLYFALIEGLIILTAYVSLLGIVILPVAILASIATLVMVWKYYHLTERFRLPIEKV